MKFLFLAIILLLSCGSFAKGPDTTDPYVAQFLRITQNPAIDGVIAYVKAEFGADVDCRRPSSAEDVEWMKISGMTAGYDYTVDCQKAGASLVAISVHGLDIKGINKLQDLELAYATVGPNMMAMGAKTDQLRNPAVDGLAQFVKAQFAPAVSCQLPATASNDSAPAHSSSNYGFSFTCTKDGSSLTIVTMHGLKLRQSNKIQDIQIHYLKPSQ